MSDLTPPKHRRPGAVGIGKHRARVVRGPDDNGLWYWRIDQSMGDGTRVTHGSGWWSQSEVEQVVAALATGRLHEAESAGLTVKDLMELYVGAADDRPISARTKQTLTNFARHIVRVFDATPISQVNRAKLEEYVARRLREPARTSGRAAGAKAGRFAAPSSVLREVKVLRSAWRWAQEEGLIADQRPLRGPRLRLNTAPVRNRRTPTREVVEQIREDLRGHFGPQSWQHIAFWLLAETGMRLGEAFSLTWGNVDLAGRCLTVSGKMGRRTVPVTGALFHFLAELPSAAADEPDQPVIPGGATRSTCMLMTLTRSCLRLHIPLINPGGLRRAAVDALYSSGADPSMAGAIIGHSPTVAMRHYRSIDIAKRVAALELALTPPPGRRWLVTNRSQRRGKA